MNPLDSLYRKKGNVFLPAAEEPKMQGMVNEKLNNFLILNN